MNIQEPIFIIEPYDISKFNTIEYAENYLDVYDIDSYIAFDSNFRKLSLYKKSLFNRVKFKLFDTNIYKEEFTKHLTENLKKIYKEDFPDSNDINFLMSLLKSEEEINKQGDSFLYDKWIWFKNEKSKINNFIAYIMEEYVTFLAICSVLLIFSGYYGVYAFLGNQIHDRQGTYHISEDHAIVNIVLGIVISIFIFIDSKKRK